MQLNPSERQIESNLWPRIAVAAVCAAHVMLFGFAFLHLVDFNMDIERDLMRASDLVTGSGYSLAGPPLQGRTPLTLGSLTNLIFAIPVWFSTDPLVVHLFVVIVGAFGLWLMFRALEGYSRPAVAALAPALLLASSPWFLAHLTPWHATLAVTAAVAFYVAIAAFLLRPRFSMAIAVSVSASIAFQLHASHAVLPVLAVLTLAVYWRRLGTLRLTAALVAGLVAGAPFFFGVAGSEVRGLAHAFEGASVFRSVSWTQLMSELLWYVTPAWDTFPPHRALIAGFLVLLLSSMVLALAAVGAIASLRPNHVGRYSRVLLVSLMLGLPMALWLPNMATAKYGFVVTLPTVLLACLGLEVLLGHHRTRFATAIPLVALGALLAWGVGRTGVPYPSASDVCNMMAQRETARFVVDEAGIPHTEVDFRAHGLFCREWEHGYHYFYWQRPRDNARARETRRRNIHVALLPPGERVSAPAYLEDRDVSVAGQRLRLFVYESDVEPFKVSTVPVADGGFKLTMPVPSGRRALRMDLHINERFRRLTAPCRVTAQQGDDVGQQLPVTVVESMSNRTRFGPHRLDTRTSYRISLSGNQDSVVVRVSGCPIAETIVDVY
jgi:hypothetical protein